MWFVLLSSLGLGVVSTRLKVLWLIPITLAFSMLVARVGFLSGFHFNAVVLAVIVGAAFLQFSYLLCASLFATARLPTQRELLRAMQSAIGQELRDYFQMPQDVPQKIRLILAELELQNL
jgi:hypothetical protein